VHPALEGEPHLLAEERVERDHLALVVKAEALDPVLAVALRRLGVENRDARGGGPSPEVVEELDLLLVGLPEREAEGHEPPVALAHLRRLLGHAVAVGGLQLRDLIARGTAGRAAGRTRAIGLGPELLFQSVLARGEGHGGDREGRQ
jgi:hypothetical protein